MLFRSLRVMTVRYASPCNLPELPEGCLTKQEGEDYKITYAPRELPTPRLIALLQSAGEIREMTAQPQNVDHLIAAMYREMDL